MADATLIHDTAFLGEGVQLGEGVVVGPHAVLLGPCIIGDRVWVGSGASIGAPPEISSLPQNLAWAGDIRHAGVIVGADSVIREQAVIHQGSHRPTTIGEASWILNRAYLAHDVILGKRVTVSAGVSIGGHCWIGDAANLGMNASIHQRRVIGAGAMVGMGTPVTRDVPPFGKVYGSPPKLAGLNTVGLARFGASEELITQVAAAYESGDFLLLDLGDGSNQIAHAAQMWRAQDPQKILTTRIRD